MQMHHEIIFNGITSSIMFAFITYCLNVSKNTNAWENFQNDINMLPKYVVMERVKILLSTRNRYVFNNFLPISPISAFCWGRHARIYWLFHHTTHNTCEGVFAAVVAHHRKHHINYYTTASADVHTTHRRRLQDSLRARGDDDDY